MQIHEIPRNYRGEGRILYIFSTKGLLFTAGGAGIGLLFYLLFRTIGLTALGVILMILLAVIGFAIGTLKVPESSAFEITRKTGGENIDDVIIRWFKFKQKRNRIYVYNPEKIEEETKDGQ